jgi:transcription-repair coupling factor (superfamily II helicase)
MNIFTPLRDKISTWLKGDSPTLTISGVSQHQWGFITLHNTKPSSAFDAQNQIMVFENNDDAENFYHSVKKYNSNEVNVIHFPGHDASPYSSLVSSQRNLLYRFRILDTLLDNKKENIILTSVEALSLKLPPREFFKEYSFNIEVSDIIGPDELAGKLIQAGYSHTHTVEEPGSFSKKGEIFDIFPVAGTPVRIHYFDDMVEEIYHIDKDTHKTIKDSKVESLKITPGPGILVQSNFANQLRGNVVRPTPAQKNKFERRKQIFEQLSDGNLFDDFPVYTPLFFDKTETLLDYVNKSEVLVTFINDSYVEEKYSDLKEELLQDYNESLAEDGECLIPEPSSIYDQNIFQSLSQFKRLNVNNITIHEHIDDESVLDINFENTRQYLANHINIAVPKHQLIQDSLNFIQKEFKYSGNIIFTVQNDFSKNEIMHIFDVLKFDGNLLSRIEFIDYKLESGFYYDNDKTLIVSDSDLFSIKRDKAKSNKIVNYDLFAEQLASLKEGDYIVHSQHGIGKYNGLETMNIGGSQTDYLTLVFKGNDKVFVPIYKMNLIQKFADSTASVAIDSLRTNKFSNVKARAKESAKKLAFDLLKLQAERQSSASFAFSAPDHEFNEFELDFPFNETPDQKSAIESVIDKMQSPVPMDFLVCGDVGFGKTEVAMRAAYKAVLDGKQVAVLVPTTVLALQHYNSFLKRFKNFAVNIDFLSRFKSGKQERETKEALENGDIDIIIGTHKLLSKTIKFKDLGLVVVDEEQRFGVSHKNQLKLLKTTVDFLTLTATPIPRTLQLSFLGIKDLALIKTAPPRRQSIKTYLIKEDDHTLQSAINRELRRGGQVFIVHNRVQDMENYVAYIKELVPSAKIVYAHGQMPEKELEEKISAFYKGAYQILVSTTIIESGIDIPNANTMIVDRADRYGLAQLHQLRGRIGRSDKKAYAYFVIPSNRGISEVAQKRLKALQTYADMGAGFQIANADLEIRGAGDILGAQQSGHIEAIGLELYMELLSQAIHEIRGEKKIIKKDIEINTPFASFIPNHYIQDSSERLRFYKQLSNIQNIDEITNAKETLYDIYGPLPVELENLFSILAARVHLLYCAIKSVQVVDAQIILQFDSAILNDREDLRNNIINTFISQPKKFQFTPDFKLIYKHKEQISPSFLIEFCADIAEQIVPS